MESPTHSVFFLWNWSRNLTRTEVQRPWFPQSWWELLWVQVGFTRSSVLSQILLFFFFLGPIASYFTNRFGCRIVTIAGAILAAGGLALSCAAKSIVFLYFTVGILTGKKHIWPFFWETKNCDTGLGFGLIYLPAIVSVSIYFEKKRAFATGIAVCGSGLGTFIMAPVTKG